MGASLICGIPVHPGDPRLGHKMAERIFYLFGTGADPAKGQIAAARTQPVCRAVEIAVMAAGAFLYPVKGERYATIGTAQDVTANGALQEVGKTSSVEEYQTLPRTAVILFEQLRQAIRYRSVCA
jgi:hypothetical protein